MQAASDGRFAAWRWGASGGGGDASLAAVDAFEDRPMPRTNLPLREADIVTWTGEFLDNL